MGKNKLKHFAEMLSFPNVIQGDRSHRGKWHKVFDSTNPITLELACGKGEYTIGLAQKHSDRNFIGIDIKGARIYTGARKALELELSNVKFLRMQIDHLPEYFTENEISEIWITFPDPHLRLSRAKQRLTSKKYIDIYRKVLTYDGTINLKTDDNTLYNFTLEVIDNLNLRLLENIADVYAISNRDAQLDIKTYYESKHLAAAKTIKYLRFSMS